MYTPSDVAMLLDVSLKEVTELVRSGLEGSAAISAYPSYVPVNSMICSIGAPRRGTRTCRLSLPFAIDTSLRIFERAN